MSGQLGKVVTPRARARRAPRHRAEHTHTFYLVAEFSGRRSGITVCECGQTRAVFAPDPEGVGR